MPGKNYMCCTCKVKHSPPRVSDVPDIQPPQPTHGSTTLVSHPDDSSIAHDLEHGIDNERYSGVISSGQSGHVEPVLLDLLV